MKYVFITMKSGFVQVKLVVSNVIGKRAAPLLPLTNVSTAMAEFRAAIRKIVAQLHSEYSSAELDTNASPDQVFIFFRLKSLIYENLVISCTCMTFCFYSVVNSFIII